MSLCITKNPQDCMSCFIIGDCLHIEYCILIECSACIAIVQVRVCTCKCARQTLNVRRFPICPWHFHLLLSVWQWTITYCSSYLCLLRPEFKRVNPLDGTLNCATSKVAPLGHAKNRLSWSRGRIDIKGRNHASLNIS